MTCGCFGIKSIKAKRPSYVPNVADEIDGYQLDNVREFSDKELRLATDDYNSNNKIGRGGFGTVYQKLLLIASAWMRIDQVSQTGTFGTLRDGRRIAVKTLSVWSKQGVREFLAEIKTLSNVKHPNLVELIGFCIQGPSRTLVYEYVENGSLNSALLGSWNENMKLDWRKRSAICLGTAKGLAFLHEELSQPIVHRDIKASNVLLDRDFNPKIGDFGLAKLFPDDITHISTRIAGTTGYLAPEYALGGQLTKKADIYSFGVLILEIISGRSSARRTNRGGKLLLEWAWQLYEEGKLLEFVDSDMEEFAEEEVMRYMKVALFCTQSAASRRPLMTQVVDMLSKAIQINEKELTAPGFFTNEGDSSARNSNPVSSITYTHVTVTQVSPR